MFYTKKVSTSIYEWYVKDKQQQIDFNPSYQRVSGLWSEQSKQLLIDSIFNMYDLPKFYIAYFFSKGNVLNNKEYLYAIIDGKQRFHAIFEFLDDAFPTSKEFVLYDYPDFNVSNKKYSQITFEYPELKSFFENYMLDIVLVETDEKDRIEELFLRLNEGKHLTNAEKRYAINGFLNNEIKQIIGKNEFFDKLEFRDKRFDYYDLALKLFLIFENKFEPIALNKSNLDNLVNDFKEQTSDLANLVELYDLKLKEFSNLLEGTKGLLNTKTNIPIYYLFFFNNTNVSLGKAKDFLYKFEELRKINRIEKEDSAKNEVLLEYDRLNQQGTTSKESLENRLKIIEASYLLYLNDELDSDLNFKLELNIDID
ncbi:DUF262 domain-containing protein [Sporosarcina sp. ACRSL]|uniref:DUF262 domain-containing protein n=1 Tax=Sporosarcina sp. ACRSL TaxID=2918215 RepID=UPI001EF71B6C|nr:DUF262 domain-containing protein [Sporosarcina sp. ACRSL]MCG7345517.1 DUF262 domain-containing protein [Sporosarcina sp. ACRSL]